MSNTSRKCSATTKAGSPCRAWALTDSDPPLCSAHSGANEGAGAPKGNQNARTHGFYATHFTLEEINALSAHLHREQLTDEIALTRTALNRLTAYLNDLDLSHAEYLEVFDLILTATGRIASLLRINKAIAPENSDLFSNVFAIALDELSERLGVDL